MNSAAAVCEQITDGLARQGYSIIDQFMDEGEVKSVTALEEFKRGSTLFKKAGVGKQGRMINENIRGDYINWIDREKAGPGIEKYFKRLDELIVYLNQNLFLSLKDFEIHMTIYPKGSGYQRHIDQFRQDDHRRLSVLLYLNREWEPAHGGQLRMYLPEGPVDIFPASGRFVCFRSDQIEHEVLPATRERLSLTGWILDRPAGLSHL